MCVDPKPLNKALKRSHYLLPVIEDILPQLAKARVFSVCDVRNGFWHIPLNERSSRLTTFSTPFGRYYWNRLPFGISPAPEIFQRQLEVALENLPGINIVADDVLIHGEGDSMVEAERDHDRCLVAFLKRCREQRIFLNPEKFRFRLQEVRYAGHVFTAQGLKIDLAKVKAISDMPTPTDKTAVRRLLGMINYLSRFVPQLTDMAEPLRVLTRKEAIFEWTDVQNAAWTRIQEAISTAPVLRYYDSRLSTELQCDASRTGLGAALLQKGQPVTYASRALTPVETGYAQIEKELLAVVFGMKKFRQYVYGRDAITSDHKPLESICAKPLMSASVRLQRML